MSEMNNISCEVIKDLLPLYIDGAASEGSKKLVEDHVKDCADCRKEMKEMSERVSIPVSGKAEMEKAELFAGIRRAFRRKKVRVAVVSAVAAVLAVTGIYVALVIPSMVIPYEDGLMKITEHDDKVYAQFTGDNYSGVYLFTADRREADGTVTTVAAIYYDETLYSRFIEPLIKKDKAFDNICVNETYWETNDSGNTVDVNPELKALYYSPKKIDGRSTDWEKDVDEMELIWENDQE